MNMQSRLERVENVASELAAGLDERANDPRRAARALLADREAVELLARLTELEIVHGPDHPDVEALAARADARAREVLAPRWPELAATWYGVAGHELLAARWDARARARTVLGGG